MITILQKHYRKIGKKGGLALLKKRGKAYFKELRRKGLLKQKNKQNEK